MSCGELLLKNASSIFNGYFLLVGIAFILYGLTSSYHILKTNNVETLGEELVALPSLSLIIFGFFLLLLIIFGCCGICREIPCCLETYAIFLTVLATIQMGFGGFCLLRFKTNLLEFVPPDNYTKPIICCLEKYDNEILETNNIIGWSLIIVGITEVIAAIIGLTLSWLFWRNSRILWI